MDWSSVRCSQCKAEFAVEDAEATIIGPLEALPTARCQKCGGEAAPRAFLPDLALNRRRRIVVDISGRKSSIHDRAKVDFYNRAGVRWVEVANDTAKSPEALKAVCQALALSVESSHQERIWGYDDSP